MFENIVSKNKPPGKIPSGTKIWDRHSSLPLSPFLQSWVDLVCFLPSRPTILIQHWRKRWRDGIPEGVPLTYFPDCTSPAQKINAPETNPSKKYHTPPKKNKKNTPGKKTEKKSPRNNPLPPSSTIKYHIWSRRHKIDNI